MEKILTFDEQCDYLDLFVQKHPNETTDWDNIVESAEDFGSTIFLSNSYKKLPVRYKGNYILRRKELGERHPHYRWAIQVAKR